MLKAIGMMAVAAAGIFTGIEKSRKYGEKVKFLKSFIKMILSLKTEIRYSGETLGEILKNLNIRPPLKKYTDACLNNLKKDSFANSWENAFSHCLNEAGISGEEESAIKNFGKELGACDIEGQLSYCDYNLKILNGFLKSAEESQKAKSRLPIILGASLSFGIIIFFI